MGNGIINKRLNRGVKLFFFLFALIVTIGYLYDFLLKMGQLVFIDYLNLLGIAINLVLLIFVYRRKIQLKIGLSIIVYFLIFNSILSVVSHIYQPTAFAFFLRDAIFFSIIIVFVTFIVGKWHGILISGIFISYLIVFSQIHNNQFLKENVFLLVLIYMGLAVVLYFLKSVFDQAIIESMQLFGQLKSRNVEIENQNDTLKEQAFELTTLNKVLINKEETLSKQADELQVANDTKNKLFSIIAHDLKDSVGTVQSSSHLLLERFDTFTPVKQREFIELIDSSIAKVADLMENLLHWSRSQSARISFKARHFNLYQLSLLAIEPVMHRISAKAIKIKNSIPHDMEMQGDQQLLEIVLRNLIGNAAKFTPEYETIQLSAVEFENHILVEVIDSGVGMPDTEYKKVFSRVIGESSLGTEGERGTGLGLALCKEFVEMHRGTIGAKPNHPTGAIFWFSIPKT